MINLRSDERHLLAASRPSGCLVKLDGISESRLMGIRRKWQTMKWLNPDSDELTDKAMHCKVSLPDVEPVTEVTPEPDEEPGWLYQAEVIEPDEPDADDLDEPEECDE